MALSKTARCRETEPLLPSDTSSARLSPSSWSERPRTRCTWPWLRVVLLAMLAGAISCVGEDLLAAPRIRLFESTLCSRYYAQHEPSGRLSHGQVPEHLCKVDPVQDELAAVMGGQYFFDSIPAILFPVPYGLLADKYGRKWILVMSSIGYTLSYAWTFLAVGALNLPLPWVWLSSAFFLLGGGPAVATYLITTMVADVVPPASRSTVFFYRYCTDLIADLTIPPLTSYLMSRDIWIPLICAGLFQGLGCFVCMALPETAPWPTKTDNTDETDSGLESREHPTADDASSLSARHPERLKRMVESLYSFLTLDRTVAALIFTFMISKVGRQCSNILLQYVSKRYDWTLAEAGLLVSLRASVNILLFTIILPVVAAFILRRLGAPTLRDLMLARGSILLLLLGAGVLALSTTAPLMITGVILFTLGTGFPHAARSLMTSIAESRNGDKTTSDIARLYAFVSVAEGIGSLVAALSLSWTFRIGLGLGRQWLGLPFGFTAVLFALVALVVFSINSKNI